MRIALLSYEYPTETGFGGIGTYTWYHARALVRLGHEVDVLAGAAAPCELRREDHDGVRVYRHRHEPPWSHFGSWLDKASMWWTKNRIENAFSMKHGLGRLLEKRAYDVVEMPECGGEGAFLHDEFEVPTIIKFHSPAKLIMSLYDQPRLDRVFCPMIEQRAIRRASALTACSQFLAVAVADGLGVERPVKVVPNGIDLALFDAADVVDMRARLEIPMNRPMVLFCGRLERRKGIHVMKEVAARILAERDAAFVFAGEDVFEYGAKEIEQRLREARNHGSYHLLGRLLPHEVRSFLRQADVFVIPSLWENCPYSCLEAMAAGRAIVSSDAGGLPELVHHEENGLVAAAENIDATVEMVNRLLDDSNLRTRLGETARRTVETSHSDEVTAARAVECYDQARAS